MPIEGKTGAFIQERLELESRNKCSQRLLAPILRISLHRFFRIGKKKKKFHHNRRFLDFFTASFEVAHHFLF